VLAVASAAAADASAAGAGSGAAVASALGSGAAASGSGGSWTTSGKIDSEASASASDAPFWSGAVACRFDPESKISVSGGRAGVGEALWGTVAKCQPKGASFGMIRGVRVGAAGTQGPTTHLHPPPRRPPHACAWPSSDPPLAALLHS
jgi:hypothetical protein